MNFFLVEKKTWDKITDKILYLCTKRHFLRLLLNPRTPSNVAYVFSCQMCRFLEGKLIFHDPPHPHPMLEAWLNAEHDENMIFLPCNCSYKNDLWRFHGIVSTLSSSDKLLHVKHVAWPLDAQWRLLWNVSFLEVKLANSINIGWGCGGEWIRWLWTI